MNRSDVKAFCRMVEHSPLAFGVTGGTAHRVSCMNSAFRRLTGLASEDLLDRPFVDVVPASRSDGSLALLDRVWETGHGEAIAEVEHQLAEDRRAIRSYTAWPVLDEKRRVVALVVQVSDVTELIGARRVEAERAAKARKAAEHLLVAGLKEQQQAEDAKRHLAELDALLKRMSEGVVVVDQDHRIVVMNDAARKIFRVPPDQKIWPPMNQDQLRHLELDRGPIPPEQWPIARVLRGEPFKQHELMLVYSDGSERRVLVSGGAIPDEDDGQPALAFVVARDVTELRETETLKDQLISLIAHDLRGPLTAILGSADLLRLSLAQKGQEHEVGFADRIARAVKTMNGMIGELMASTGTGARTLYLDKRLCHLRDLASEALEHLISPEHRSRLKTEFPDELIDVPCDPDRIQRVFMNLLGNALKYSPPGAPVTVRLEQNGAEVLVSVADPGVGISAEDLPHVFDRFYRAKSGDKADGFGLGLYSSRLIVEAHGGRIWAESEPGKGSTFYFTLPLE